MTRPEKKSRRERDSNAGSSALEADALTTRPTRRGRGGGEKEVGGGGGECRQTEVEENREDASEGGGGGGWNNTESEYNDNRALVGIQPSKVISKE